MGSPSTSTRELVEATSRSSPGAIDALLERFLPDLERYVARRRGALAQRESAADIVQSVCRELLERLGDGRFEYRGEPAFRTWLYRAALMKLSARRRFWGAERREAQREVLAPDAGERDEDAVDGPSRALELEEELDVLRAALASLPARSREIVALSQAEGCSHREIAARLGVTEEHSRVLLSRALARLSTLISREPFAGS